MKNHDHITIWCDGVKVEGGLHFVPPNAVAVRIFSPFTGMVKNVVLAGFKDDDSIEAKEYISSVACSSLRYLYYLGYSWKKGSNGNDRITQLD